MPFCTRRPTAPVRLNPDVPDELARIVNKALEKDRTLRYQHASDLLTDLKRLKRDSDSSRSAAVDGAAKIASTPAATIQSAKETMDLGVRPRFLPFVLLGVGIVWIVKRGACTAPRAEATQTDDKLQRKSGFQWCYLARWKISRLFRLRWDSPEVD